jgi:hypothetical protein
MDSTPFFRGVAVTLIALLALLLSFAAFGQGATGSAAFEGRPAMAGAQGGVGAQAGPPQGGIGVQGSDAAQLRLGRPGIAETPRSAAAPGLPRVPGMPPGGSSVDRPAGSGVSPPRDPGIAREEQSATRKVKRVGKRAVDRARRNGAQSGGLVN